MCGIVAVFGDISVKVEQAFKQMLIFDSVRGLDSTGVAVIARTGEVSIVKEVGNPFYVLECSRFEKAMKGSIKGLIGHNRAATTGRVLRKNAHPFETDNLVGVHNGTISSKFDIPGHVPFDTDSEALYNCIDNQGVETTIPLLTGAWSLIWYDKEFEEINLLRNAERPMTYAFTKDKKTLFCASEMWMIFAACHRNGVDIGDVVSTTENVHYTYKMPGFFKEFAMPRTQVIEGKKKIVIQLGATQANSAGGQATSPIKKEAESNVIPIRAKDGETHLATNTQILVRGIQIYEQKLQANSIFYALFKVSSPNIITAPLYMYKSSKEELDQFLEDEWMVTIARPAVNNGVISRYILNNSETTYYRYIPEVHKPAFPEGERCCNCNSKLEASENWTKTSQGILCEECSSDQNVLELISQMNYVGY